WILTWTADDAAWWRALDGALSRRGGWARVELPSFDLPLDPGRRRDPLETLEADIARALDDAPLTSRIRAPLGNLTLDAEQGSPGDRDSVEVRVADGAEGQARAVVDAILAALERGTPVEQIAIAMPRANDESADAIMRGLEEAGLPAYDGRGHA